MLKPGIKSTEWWGLVIVAAMAAAKMFGIIPEDATTESLAQQASESLPVLINGVIALVSQNSPILVVAGLVWAWMRRRTALKGKELK